MKILFIVAAILFIIVVFGLGLVYGIHLILKLVGKMEKVIDDEHEADNRDTEAQIMEFAR